MKIATKAIIARNNKYLLQLRDNNKKISSPNCWGFFGGKVKKYETPTECIHRELLEELSIECKILGKPHKVFNKNTNFLHYYFNVKPIGKIKLKNLTEGQNLGWFNFKQIKKIKTAWETKTFFNLKLKYDK